ncbi:MAG: Amidase [Bradyrhizobium sp.]|nr:Amidase [Bradyrhizobium sp.]
MTKNPALEIAARVLERKQSARSVVEATLADISKRDRDINAFTQVTAERALSEAAQVDAAIGAGRNPGPLAGVPFAVKDLFDIAGVPTKAGSKIHAARRPAERDATAVRRLNAAGAVLVGALNMEEYAYGFYTDNPHHGRTLNPHDRTRTAGGSAAAVAAGLVPIALGSDTNGSIRVPSSFCGIFGLKPTYGRLSRAGSLLFVSSLDHIGPLAQGVGDLAAVYDALQGPDSDDAVCAQRAPEPVAGLLGKGRDGLRIAVAGGYFAEMLSPESKAAVDAASQSLGVVDTVDIPGSDAARAAAYVITSVEAARERFTELHDRIDDFDPNTRYRFLAGAFLPADWYVKAQQFRRWYSRQLAGLFQHWDVILAPVAPIPAPCFTDQSIIIDGKELALRPLLGRFVQALAPAGLPIVVAPFVKRGALPVGVQIVAAPFKEDHALRVARALESSGLFGPLSL